jgi:hypothetical protein
VRPARMRAHNGVCSQEQRRASQRRSAVQLHAATKHFFARQQRPCSAKAAIWTPLSSSDWAAEPLSALRGVDDVRWGELGRQQRPVGSRDVVHWRRTRDGHQQPSVARLSNRPSICCARHCHGWCCVGLRLRERIRRRPVGLRVPWSWHHTNLRSRVIEIMRCIVRVSSCTRRRLECVLVRSSACTCCFLAQYLA